MKKIRPSLIGLAVAVLVTAVAGGLWTIGRENWICVALWPGMMLGWAFVFGDNINSFHDVSGTITLISLLTNGIAGLLIGALTGLVVRGWKRHARRRVCEQPPA
jgi:hypothetical protein